MAATSVLLADDDVRLRQFLELELREEGYAVRSCGDGIGALTQIRQEPPDLLVLDWMLPDLSGVEVCQRLRSTGVQVPVLILAIFSVALSYMTTNTRFGRYAYAIGGNREAARLSGINIRNNIFLVFVLMGFLCGVAGVVLASYVGYGTIAAGQGYELDAIAAAILGGTSTLGGVGTIWGALIGALIMSSLSNGLQLLNVAPAWQYLLKGVVLVLAVYADVTFKKRS